MTAAKYHSSRPDQWVSPKPTRDPRKCGPLLPMQEPRRSLLVRVAQMIGAKPRAIKTEGQTIARALLSQVTRAGGSRLRKP